MSGQNVAGAVAHLALQRAQVGPQLARVSAPSARAVKAPEEAQRRPAGQTAQGGGAVAGGDLFALVLGRIKTRSSE